MRPQVGAVEYQLRKTDFLAYGYFGAHLTADGCVFRAWLPYADGVFVVGDFCGWENGIPMKKISNDGIWECMTDIRVSVGDKYKFRITVNDRVIYKADPYAFCTEAYPNTASVVCDTDSYKWRDGGWLDYRSTQQGRSYEGPMNVYELHIGSWKRRDDGSAYTYKELASELATYVKQMGYTHVQLMPVAEHADGTSWGYRTCSYFAPSTRYGTPKDLMSFVDSMHEAGIGVILDLTLAYFSTESDGLSAIDGQHLYEREQDKDGWVTKRFDITKRQVAAFVASNVVFWIDKYHVDGIKLTGTELMLRYESSESAKNIGAAKQMLSELGTYIKKEFPGVLMIADSPMGNGELGFDMEWNTAWTRDTLCYAETDPLFRKYDHEKLTLSPAHAFGKRCVLPVSHTDLTHGRRSFIDKMHGDYWQKFASVRAFMGYMMTYPSKKLSFMGTEIGQFKEWSGEPIEWFLLDYEPHAKLQRYVSELNHLYLSTPALWQIDSSWDGFEWIEPNDRDRSIISYRRRDRANNELIVLINFTPVVYEGHRLGVSSAGVYKEIFNSDSECFGGSGVVNTDALKSEAKPWSFCENSITMRVPPLAVTIFKCVEKTSSKRKTVITSSTKRKIIKK